MEEEKLTKKERRALAKEKKKQERERREKIVKLKKLFVWAFGVVFIGFIGVKIWNFFKIPRPEIAGEAVYLEETDWIKGSKEAKITLIEYSDFQCPACASYALIIRQLAEDFSDDLKIVYRHFPLIPNHKNALLAALAAEAAGKQGKFWEMHDRLFEKQGDWSEERDPKEKFILYAEELELDKDTFIKDFESNEVEEKVNRDLSLANSLSLNSTPSFFLNGEKIKNPQGYEEFKELIKSEIRGYTLE